MRDNPSVTSSEAHSIFSPTKAQTKKMSSRGKHGVPSAPGHSLSPSTQLASAVTDIIHSHWRQQLKQPCTEPPQLRRHITPFQKLGTCWRTDCFWGMQRAGKSAINHLVLTQMQKHKKELSVCVLAS